MSTAGVRKSGVAMPYDVRPDDVRQMVWDTGLRSTAIAVVVVGLDLVVSHVSDLLTGIDRWALHTHLPILAGVVEWSQSLATRIPDWPSVGQRPTLVTSLLGFFTLLPA